jgi:hypothetical protein
VIAVHADQHDLLGFGLARIGGTRHGGEKEYGGK